VPMMRFLLASGNVQAGCELLCSADIPRAHSHANLAGRSSGLRTGDLSRSVSRYDDRQE
jgi:hypothetical protein